MTQNPFGDVWPIEYGPSWVGCIGCHATQEKRNRTLARHLVSYHRVGSGTSNLLAERCDARDLRMALS
jgi:hypothetical protein